MKLLSLILVIVTITNAMADTSDPVADYKKLKSLISTDTLYKWAADITGNGHNSVFLTFKTDYDEDAKVGQVPGWIVYFASKDGNSYTKSTGLDEGSGTTPVLAQIDPNLMFIGRIRQLGKIGIVTVQNDTPKKKDPVSYVYALTVENGHFRKTILATYNPDQTENAIFDQYLSDAHRTKVRLQQVSP